MHGSAADVIYALRRLRAAPSFTFFSIFTLALGIGATTAIYSVVYATVLRPPDIADIGRVANLYHSDPRRGGGVPTIAFSRADFEDYRKAQTSFESLAAWQRFRLPFSANGTVDLLIGEAVGGEYFAVVGVRPALGRTILPSDDTLSAPRVMVLSDQLWRVRFGADPTIVGRTVKLSGELFEVVGVAPATFRGVDMPNVLPTAGWIPLAAAPLSDPSEITDRQRRTVFAKGRLSANHSLDEARAELQAIARRLDLAYPIGTGLDRRIAAPYNTSRRWSLIPAANVKMHESVDAIARPLAATIMVAVGLVLLVACTNVANLVLARGTARRHETAVRLALGAGRWRLVREQIIESGLLTVAGTILAFPIARLLMVRLLSGDVQLGPSLFVQFAPEMNTSVAVVAATSSIIALFVFGVIPAFHGSRANVRQVIASEGPSTSLARWRGRRGLIACQVAVAAGLVSVSVLCAEQLIGLAQHDTGLDLDRLAVVRVGLATPRDDETTRRRVAEQLLASAHRLPTVQSAALSSGFPIEFGSRGGSVGVTPEQFTGGRYDLMVASPHVFATWGVRLMQGRIFDDRDSASSERVVVLTERLAQNLFANGSAIGRHIVVRFQPLTGKTAPPIQTHRVIGVVADTDYGTVGNRGGGSLYLPWNQNAQYVSAITVTVRTSGDPAALVDMLKRLVGQINPELLVMDAKSASLLGGERTLVLKVGAAAAGLLGGLALILAMAGLYGVLSELVLSRTRELGIRMALGADSKRLIQMVLLDGARPVVAGLAIGLTCGVILRVAFRPMFIRMLPAFDPLIVSLVPIAFIVAALLAAYLPASRAARVDPNVALRHL
ncbi:MAG TPA: ADOP family duplicated permease [Vicinamibacterales bacterium]|nr:ADOP family duplicated permease [Vicinamibacterales bacterium]